MSFADSVRTSLPACVFHPPASPDAVASAEQALGHPLPAPLRDLYSAFDGFEGPTNAPFMYPLLRAPSPMGAALVPYTQFLRLECADVKWLHRAVAVGGEGVGPSWFILLDDPETIVQWDAEWGDEYEVCSGTLLDVWIKSNALYASLLGDA
jgi:hypothetical protein